MTLRYMEIFRALCQNEYNTTKTAQMLNMTQPAVSLAIKELESYYGIALFDRIGRKLVITTAGKKLDEYSTIIEGLFLDMETDMKNWNKQGIIRVGATLTIGTKFLPAHVKEFCKNNLKTKIKGFCGPTNILERKILDNEMDFAFSEGIAQDSSITSQPYMDDKLVVFCSADSKYNNGETISAEEFAKNKFVLREKDGGSRKFFDVACEKAGISVEPDWEYMNNCGVYNAVAAGLGIGVLSYRLVADGVAAGKVKTLKVEGLDLNRKFYIIKHKNKRLSQSAEQFIEFVKNTDVAMNSTACKSI